ncbi:2582_t:CDS:1, partial [Rhizophagus irregularis]
YIRNWKTEVVCAQLYLSQLQFKDYKEQRLATLRGEIREEIGTVWGS